MAARAGQSEVVRYLVQNGAQVEAKAKVKRYFFYMTCIRSGMWLTRYCETENCYGVYLIGCLISGDSGISAGQQILLRDLIGLYGCGWVVSQVDKI